LSDVFSIFAAFPADFDIYFTFQCMPLSKLDRILSKYWRFSHFVSVTYFLLQTQNAILI